MFHYCIVNPEITEAPLPKIVAEDERDVSFSCTATGNPIPKITWMYRNKVVRPNRNDHNDDDDNDDDDDDLRIETPELDREERTVTSTLMFSSVEGEDSGRIECIASVPPGADTGDFQLNPAKEKTQLSVLGEL